MPFLPVATGAARVAGTGVGKTFDVLNRASAANQARILRGPQAYDQTLMHSETPEQYQADTAELARRGTQGYRIPNFLPVGPPGFGGKTTPAMTKAQYDAMPGWWHQAAELINAIRYDPLTYVGGVGVLDHLGEAVASKSIPAFSRAVEQMLASTNPEIRLAGKGLASAYDATHFKGAAQRALAAKHGEEGLHYFRGLKAINNVRKTKAGELGGELVQQYHDVTKGLTPGDEADLYHAIHTGTVANLPPNLSMRAAKFKQITDSLAHLEGTGEVQRLLKEGGNFDLPAELKRFDAEVPRGMQGPGAYRERYVPTASAAKKDLERPSGSLLSMDQPATGEARSLLEILRTPVQEAEGKTPGLVAKDTNLLRRGEGAQLLSPALQRRVVEARLRGGAQAISAHDAEQEVSKLFGKDTWAKVPNDAKAFFQETWKEPGGAQFWGNLVKKGIDIPKAALFALPFRHMANIASLGFLADPSIANVTGAAGRFVRMMATRDPATRDAIMGKAGKYGIGASSFDRKPGWVGEIPLLGRLYKASNHTLWTFDDAAKATRFDRLLKSYTQQGMDEAHAAYKAADRVGGEMVDYANNSPLTQILRYIFPFAAWRTKFPFAVAGSVGRHPEVATNIGRASPEMIGDVQAMPGGQYSQYGEQQGGKSNLPLPETFRAVENPWEFGRAALGYPAQMALSNFVRPGDEYKNYLTYGKDPDLKYLLNATVGQFPFAGFAMNKASGGNLSEFQSQGDLSGTLGQQLGFSTTHGPSPQQMETGFYVQEKLAAISAAYKSGNGALAKILESDLKYYLKTHEQYEK